MTGRRALAEGIGTFFLVLIGPGAVMVNASTGGALGPTGVALAFAFVVLAMVLALGHLSGAHINPAVTLAFWSVGRFPLSQVAPYVGAQCAGAVAASAVLRWVLGPVGGLGATFPHVGIARAFVVEGLLSFVLMLVIMAVATDDRAAGRGGRRRGGIHGGILRSARCPDRVEHESRTLVWPGAGRRRMERALDLLGGAGRRHAAGGAHLRAPSADGGATRPIPCGVRGAGTDPRGCRGVVPDQAGPRPPPGAPEDAPHRPPADIRSSAP